MDNEIEKRLHRVMITLEKGNVMCPYSKECLRAETCGRCNDFYQKCALFHDFISDSK
jgi:hypothetical protein